MAFVPVPATIEVRCEFTVGNAEQMVNVLHFQNPDEVELNGAVFDDMWPGISNPWDANLATVISDEVVFSRITAKDISAADLPVFSANPFSAGSNVSEALPYPVSLVATLRTAVGSRGGRGRIFVGGFCESHNEGGDLASAAAVTAVQGWVAGMATVPINAGGTITNFFLGVTSRAAHVGGDPGGAPIAPVTRAMESYDVNRRWDIQRRRSNKIRA